MPIKTIPLSALAKNLGKTLSDCADSGSVVVVKLPDRRLVAIQQFDPAEDDDHLIDNLIQHNAAFRELLAKSKASPRKPYRPLRARK